MAAPVADTTFDSTELKDRIARFRKVRDQILAQVLWLGCPIGEVTCPARYLPEASSINLRRSIYYGLGCLATALEYRWAKMFGRSYLFPKPIAQ